MLKAISAQTYLITGGHAAPHTFSIDRKKILDLVERAAAKGISMVQLREKKLTGRQLFELGSSAALITANSGTKLMINDRADIAYAAGADGVHLTARSLPASVIRQNFPDLIIGVSAHSTETAIDAKERGADFITFSPIFETLSKADYGPPQGVEKLTTVVDALADFPVFALGGIDSKNYQLALDAGASGIAGISWLNELVMAN